MSVAGGRCAVGGGAVDGAGGAIGFYFNLADRTRILEATLEWRDHVDHQIAPFQRRLQDTRPIGEVEVEANRAAGAIHSTTAHRASPASHRHSNRFSTPDSVVLISTTIGWAVTASI